VATSTATQCSAALPTIATTNIKGQYWAVPFNTNAGLLYTAKGTASLLVPLGNVLAQATGGWHSVFLAAAAMNLVAALAAPLVLRPLRVRHAASLAASGAATGRPSLA